MSAHLRVVPTQCGFVVGFGVAIYSFQHDYISVKRHGHGRARAGVRYITRDEADYVFSYGFPGTDRKGNLSYDVAPTRMQLRAQMQAIEDAQKRKDARIAHTMIVANPLELDFGQQKSLARAFAFEVSKGGKAPFVGAIHGAESHNPHVHGYLVDREVTFSVHKALNAETGKWETKWFAELGPSVNKLTHKPRERIAMGLEPNATEWLRTVWEKRGNHALEMAGHEPTLDRRSYMERGIDRTPEEHRGWGEKVEEIAAADILTGPEEKPSLDNEASTPILLSADDVVEPRHQEPSDSAEIILPEPVEHPAPESTETPVESDDQISELDEFEEADLALTYIDKGIDRGDRPGRIRSAAEEYVNLTILQHDRSNLQFLRESLSTAEAMLKDAEQVHEVFHKDHLNKRNILTLADDQLQTYLRGEKLRGFQIPVKLNLGLWKFERTFKSPTRQKAEAARSIFQKAEMDEQDAAIAKNEAAYLKAVTERAATEARMQVEKLEAELRDRHQFLGTDQEMDAAETLFLNTITFELDGVKAEDLMEEVAEGRITEGQFYDAARAMGREDVIEHWEALYKEMDKELDEGLEP